MSNFLGSLAQLVVGVILVATGIASGAGTALIIGSLFSAAAIALTPDVSEATDDRESPTNGFAQFDNPVKGDTPIPVIYSATGHKTAPVWLQAFVTPRGMGSEDGRKASQSQQLSGLLAIAEGPIEDVTDIRFNDEPVFERIENYPLGTGNGSKKTWVIPHSRVDLQSIEILEGTTQWGYATTSTSVLAAIADGSRKTYVVALPTNIVDEVAVEFFSVNPTAFHSSQLTNFKLDLQVWMGSETEIFFHRDVPLPANTPVYMQYGARVLTGVAIKKKANGNIAVTFPAAPTTGTKLSATFIRRNIPHVDVTIRRGSAHQLPVWGLHTLRNSHGVRTSMTQGSPVTYETRDEVDSVVFDVASGSGGFIVYTDTGDARAKAQFKLEIRRKTATASGLNTFDSWYVIPDPRGADKAANKRANEFQVMGRTSNQQFWSFDVRNLLAKNAAKTSSKSKSAAAVQKAVRDFVRARYELRATRTSPVANTGNSRYLDDLQLLSVTEVRDETLNLPGTATLAFQALGSRRLNGSAPNVTLRCKGIRSVQKPEVYAGSSNGYRWRPPDAANQSNRVLAAIDLITNWRYGAGEHYDRDVNIDLASALTCANWLDETVVKGDNTSDTEVRSRLDIVLDTRKSLMEHLRDILQVGRIWAVLRGNTWYFVKDDAVDLTSVPVLYDDTPAGRTAKNSLGFSHDTVVSRPTEVQITYLDEVEEFQPKQVWVVPEEPGDEPRRIRRVTARGTVRRTETSRYGQFVYHQLRYQGASLGVGAAPKAINFGAGGVIRVVSNRVGIDGYWRIFSLSMDTDTYYVSISAKQYIPSNYGQNVAAQHIITDGFPRVLPQRTAALTAPAAFTDAQTQGGRHFPETPAVSIRRDR